MGAYQSQLAKLTHQDARKKTPNSSDDMVVYELMKRRGDEQAHHKGILETLDVLYKGLDDQQSAELSAYLNQHGGIGNQLMNLINLPKETHQEGIHRYARDQGYEYHSATKNPQGPVLDIIEASEMPLEYRKHVGEQYLKKAVPDMNDRINDLLTDHPSMHEKLDLSSVRKALEREESTRMAGAELQSSGVADQLDIADSTSIGGVDVGDATRVAAGRKMVGDTDRNQGKVIKMNVNTEGGDFNLDSEMRKKRGASAA